MRLDKHLCCHSDLTPAERAYLDGLDLPSRHSAALFTAVAEAVLASRVDGYHQQPGAEHWKPAALKIYTAVAREGEGLSAQAVAAGASFLRDATAPADALRLLMRVDTVQRDWRRARAMSMVTTADQLPARTADRAGQLQHEAAAAQVADETGLTDSDRYRLAS